MDPTPEQHKNPERVAAGLKAVIHNPNSTDQARSHARKRLKEMGVDPDVPLSARDALHTDSGGDTPHERHVRAGYKSALKNPNVSDAAKHHAEEVLEEHHE